MKKNNLFKVIGIVILGYVALTWLVPIIASLCGETSSLSYQVGFVSGGLKLIETFPGFGTSLVFILLVGGFYGILEATGRYEKSLRLIVDKMKGKEKLFLVIIMLLIAVISSFVGLDLGFLIIFPFVISLILMMGYDKLVALSATFGSTIIGMYGATFASTLYGVNSTMLGTSLTSELVSKIILFGIGLGLLIFFVFTYIKKNNNSKHKSSKKEDIKTVKVKVKQEVEEKVTNGKKYVWPIYVIVGLLFIVFILGTTNWSLIFNIDFFNNIHESIMGWQIKDFAPVEKIFGGMDAFGTWNNPTRFQYYSLLLIFASVILCLFYKINASDSFEAFTKGIKEYTVPAFLAILAYFVFVLTYYYPILSYLTGLIDKLSDTFNVAITGVSALVSSFFYSDFYYYAYYVIYSAVSNLDDTSLFDLVSVIYTNIYGLVMLVAPTSVLLLISLSITEVSYKTWFKFIWKLFLSLLIVSFIVFIIMFAI